MRATTKLELDLDTVFLNEDRIEVLPSNFGKESLAPSVKQLKRGVTATDALDAELAKCGFGDVVAKSAATSAAAVGGLFAIAEEDDLLDPIELFAPQPKVELVETDPRAHRKLAKAADDDDDDEVRVRRESPSDRRRDMILHYLNREIAKRGNEDMNAVLDDVLANLHDHPIYQAVVEEVRHQGGVEKFLGSEAA